jgi:acyl carrier protein
MDLEAIIGQELLKQARQSGSSFAGPLGRDTSLVGTGLDSLGFTTLVIELERRLGVDPFADGDEISYPESVGELVDLYAAAGATSA